MILSLARPPFAYLVRTPRAWLPIVGWVVVAVAFAAWARSDGSASGADQMAGGPLGGLVVPLLAYAVVGGLLGASSLRDATLPVVSFGASPVRAAAVTSAVAVVASAAVGALVGIVVVLAAHGVGDPPVVRDTLATASACAWGGAAYGSLFLLGATIGRRGWGRPLLLVADWIFGRGTGWLALATPRAHLRNALAGPHPLGIGEGASLAVLALLALFLAAVAVRRASR